MNKPLESVIKSMDKNAQTDKCWITVQKRSVLLCLQFYMCIITRYTVYNNNAETCNVVLCASVVQKLLMMNNSAGFMFHELM